MLRRAFWKLDRAGKFNLYFRTVLLLYLDCEERIDAEHDSPECLRSPARGHADDDNDAVVLCLFSLSTFTCFRYRHLHHLHEMIALHKICIVYPLSSKVFSLIFFW